MSSQPLTIKEMAKIAKVSTATISRAMNSKTRQHVAKDTLKRIDSLIHQHGYSTNLAAKNLRKNLTQTIGIVFPYVPGIFNSEYYTQILSGVTEALIDSEYRFKMLLFKEGRWLDGYHFRTAEAVDGLILIHWDKVFSSAKALERLQIPFVIINDYDASMKVHFEYADHVQGGRLAAQCLFERGHRIMGIMQGPAWSKDSAQRVKGFMAYCKERQIDIKSSLIMDGMFLQERAYQQTEMMIKKNSDLSAIFCCNDQMAFGVIKKLKELSLRCPEDISIIGFDNERLSAYTKPALTTIDVGPSLLGQHAAGFLLRKLAGQEDKKSASHCHPVTLISRESVAKK